MSSTVNSVYNIKIHPEEIWEEHESGWLLSWLTHEQWCADNCQGLWTRSNGVFWFEEQADAVHFALRWA